MCVLGYCLDRLLGDMLGYAWIYLDGDGDGDGMVWSGIEMGNG